MVKTPRFREEDLARASFSARHTRTIDDLGYLILFETSIVLPQLRLFDLNEAPGEEGWMKFLKLDEYAPRQVRPSDELQQVLFPYTEAMQVS